MVEGLDRFPVYPPGIMIREMIHWLATGPSWVGLGLTELKIRNGETPYSTPGWENNLQRLSDA
ncbi:hypothetical protein PIB30_040095 [Stylosanthes scabra]|uniref:Uncharacterized protein n=1 Tax=Stylosanthes scabra TaxID=79078 RepID=A0ABU6ZD63_9FABA|nr:hypothetical protein [Stylosanthes scabra]